MTEWLEKEVYSVEESGVEELQSCRCPHCRKIMTTPYMYYFKEYPYCPSCGELIRGKKKKTDGIRETPLSATREVIKESGFSRAKVARMIVANDSTIHNYYNMQNYPNLAIFADICRVCGVVAVIKNGEVYINEKAD